MDPCPVSVIIPTYNRRQELPQAIASVLAQTQLPRELIVVDDRSTDDTTAFLDIVAREKHPIPIHVVLSPENRGVSHSRNQGAARAQMPWLAFLDSDDTWHPAKLAKQWLYAQENPDLGLIYCDELWMRRGIEVKQHAKHRKRGGWIFDDCVAMCNIGPSAVLMRKDLLQAHGGFDETFLVCEDYDLWLKVSCQQAIGYIDERLVIKHGGQDHQLSQRFFGMDQWRLRSILALLRSPHLNAEQRTTLLETAGQKSAILHISFQKHGRVAEAAQFLRIAELLAAGTSPQDIPFPPLVEILKYVQAGIQ